MAKAAKKRKTWYADEKAESELAQVMHDNGLDDESAAIRCIIAAAVRGGLVIGKEKVKTKRS